MGGWVSKFFVGSATALKAHTLCVRRKQLLARRHLLPMGLGLACTLPPGTGWLSCTSSEQRTCDCYFSQPGHFLFLPLLSGLPAIAASVVTALEGLHVCAPVELPCITLLRVVM